MAGRPRGHRKTGGRKKGTPNKLTSSVKAALEVAFAECGGVPTLTAWARENPGAFYRLWIKMLPKQTGAAVEMNGSTGDDLGEAIRSLLAEIDARQD